MATMTAIQMTGDELALVVRALEEYRLSDKASVSDNDAAVNLIGYIQAEARQ